MSVYELNIESAPIDNQCKAILKKFVQAGWTEANTTYVVGNGEVGREEFSYLNTRALLQLGGGVTQTSVLNPYMTASRGLDAGKIVFSLNVNLV